MARYIDADALIENIKRVYCTDCNNYNEVRCRACGTDDAMAMIEDAPTADVAPRAEVEELIYKLECLLCHATGGKLSKHTYDLKTMETAVTDYINESYSDGMAEVAKEIFEEIASKQITIVDHVGTMGVVVLLKDIFELKKKYTGGEE